MGEIVYNACEHPQIPIITIFWPQNQTRASVKLSFLIDLVSLYKKGTRYGYEHLSNLWDATLEISGNFVD